MQRFCLLEGEDTVPVSSPQTPYLYTHTFQADYERQFLRKLFATCSVGRPPTALRSLNGFAMLAWSVFPLHNLLLLALRSSSQLLLLGFCSYRAKAYSHAGCALAPSRCSHPCVEFPTGLFMYANKTPADCNPTGGTGATARKSRTKREVLPSFFQKRRSSPSEAKGATVRFLCQAFFLVKESGDSP